MRNQIWLAPLMLLVASTAQAEAILAAKYTVPVDRYGHFALGRPHEYARVEATTDAGRRLSLELPEHEVFEDLRPRIVRLAAGGSEEILAIVSARDSGSRLVIIGLTKGRLEVVAQAPPIGTPMRWLNPVGIADLDGDGHSEIAAVTTPHIGGTLRVYRRIGGRLEQIAALSGFSNHVYGSPELRLSAPVKIGGRMHLLVPDAARSRLAVIALDNGSLVETKRCLLPAPIVAAISVVSDSAVSVGLTSGRHMIVPADCPSVRPVS